jgi:imidazolonepropionase
MTGWDLLLTDLHAATMRRGGAAYGGLRDAAVAIADGRIAWIGPRADLPDQHARETRSMAGRWATPALIDCHTHLVFGGDRSAEFEQRLGGASYEEIARAGGGILSTVKATRAASREELFARAARRLEALQREGVATVEIKSGYGLDLDTELLMLETARALGEESGVTVRTSFLGAHTLPPEFSGRADDYIDYLCDTVLPAAHDRGLVDAVDAYCERIAFSARQVARLFERAAKLNLPVKLHADQLSDAEGAALAARFGALSADHLEYSSEAGLEALSGAGTVAVLLPGAYLTLGETRQPPVARLRDYGIPVALATDCNPGTSPLCSIRTAMALGSRLFGLTPEESLAGVTREAAAALGLAEECGTLEAGKRADIAFWDVGHPRELAYWMGLNELYTLLVGGRG